MSKDSAIGQLRHLYSLMVSGHVKNAAEAARGLLGPSIERLESAAKASEGEVEATWNLALETAAKMIEASPSGYNRNDHADRIRGLKRPA